MEGLAVSTVATILWHPSEICLTDGVAVAETENNRWAKGASRAKYTVRHYGRNYSVITEQSECGRLRFYATIESLYGANRFTETVRKQNGNFSMTPTVPLKITPHVLEEKSHITIKQLYASIILVWNWLKTGKNRPFWMSNGICSNVKQKSTNFKTENHWVKKGQVKYDHYEFSTKMEWWNGILERSLYNCY